MTTSTNGSAWYDELVRWIRRNGGEIHPSLGLCIVNDTSRGIKASRDIDKGELLIRLPCNLALDGSSLPLTFPVGEAAAASDNGDSSKSSDKKSIVHTRNASPWLRCLTSLLIERSKHKSDKKSDGASKEQGEIDFGPYLNSLPNSYDTLLDASSWPDEDVSTLLAGTALGAMVQEERRNDVLKQRCTSSVKPYLEHVGLWSSEGKNSEKHDASKFHDFKQACACVSTRGFHLQQSDGETPWTTKSSQATTDGIYSGPYLLPYVDLLNHSAEKKCTTLQRDTKNGTFTMIAERPIKAGEEIYHAYGEDLTSAQFLQTFGFVDTGASNEAAANEWSNNDCGCSDLSNEFKYGTTPATISSHAVLKACRSVLDSSFPKELINTMQELDIPDETWDLPTNERDILSHGLISDDILVTADNPLPDELVMLCCLPFLPDEAYDDWQSDPCVWNADILEDYFLGKLALRALMKSLGKKIEQYSAIDVSTCGLDVAAHNNRNGGSSDDIDVLLLRRLLNIDSSHIIDKDKRTRAIYALTIRLEEKCCLHLLKKKMISILRSLDEEEDDSNGGDVGGESGKRSSSDIDGVNSSKKIKL